MGLNCALFGFYILRGWQSKNTLAWNPGVDKTHILLNNHQRAYLFIAAGKVAWGRLGKPISLNSDNRFAQH